MNRHLYLFIFFLIAISSCKKNKSSEILLDKTVVTNCKGKTIELILPKDWQTPDRYEYEEGFLQTYIYPDKSYLTVMCGGNAELKKQKIVKENEFAREQNYNGFSLIYGNVNEERKAEFDKAFDLMKQID